MMRSAALLIACMVGLAQAETLPLSWAPPTAYTNGAALPVSAITGFEVECKASVASLICADRVLAGTATSNAYDIGAVPDTGATYCIRMRTLVAAPDLPSDWTVAVCKTFAAIPKKANTPTAVKL